MNRPRVEKQLRLDEGMRFVVYLDTRGFLTVGVGHKVVPDDHLAFDDCLTEEQITTFFATDLDQAIADCVSLFSAWDTFPDTVQEILVNMCFNLGKTGLGKFRKLRDALAHRDYRRAAQEMTESTWSVQVGDRARRLIRRMQSVNV